jgi:serine/threonine-protein kinase
MPLEIGQLIDAKYRIVRVIGEGGMGEVYEGENTLIRRRVAIKVLHTDNARNVESIRRFEREAQAAGHIGSDHILEVLDLGTLPSGDRFMVMEFLDGETLAQRLGRIGRLTPHQLVPIAMQILEALSAAHMANIVHRDLKPENVFVLRKKTGRTDFVKLIDFGISKFSNPRESVRMTREGSVMGTPCYMSPEQARGRGEADARSDIYACGVILYESVTGRVPFVGETFNDLMFLIALSDAPDPRSIVADLDPAFAQIIAKAMARDPALRFQSADDFAASLDAWQRASDPAGSAVVPSSPLTAAADTISRAHASTLVQAPEARTPPTQPTGTYETFGQSKSLSAAQRRRVPIVAGIAVASIAVLATGFSLLGRSTPPPATTAREVPSGPPRTSDPVVLPSAEEMESLAPVAADPTVDSGMHVLPSHAERRLHTATAPAPLASPSPVPAAPSAKPMVRSAKPPPSPSYRDFGY